MGDQITAIIDSWGFWLALFLFLTLFGGKIKPKG